MERITDERLAVLKRELQNLRREVERLREDGGAAAWIIEWMVADKYKKPKVPEIVERARKYYKQSLDNAEAAERKLARLAEVMKPHIIGIRRAADVLENWQDPMVGTFDATISEIRKAADELETALKESE